MPQAHSTQTERVLLADFSPSDKPWDVHGLERDSVQGLYKQAEHRYSSRLLQCAQLLDFELKFQETGELKPRLKSTFFCRVRLCPVCQWRRTLRHQAKFFQVIPRVIELFPTYRYIFLTLTVRNCPLDELRGHLKLMTAAWHKMSKNECKWWPSVGWVRSTEVTRGKDGSAHPHFHAILMVPSGYFSHGFITQADWTEKWQKAMKLDYTPIVNVKAVKGRSGETDDKGMARALCETLKYSVKPSDLVNDVDWLMGLTEQLHKTRAIATGGLLKEFLADFEKEETNDDLIQVGEEDTGEVLAGFTAEWNTNVKHYQIRDYL
jgi:plasmid rolling circle replication initiator protein Rep